jgi:hypothetical protein
MRPSVVEPVSRAMDRTARILFQPFDLRKWFVLGFCAWLAYLGENAGGGGNVGNRFRDHGEDFQDVVWSAWEWVRDHLGLVLVLAILLFALGILILWISSRGKFLFVDGVIRDRAAVAEPWREFAPLGNSLFWMRLAVSVLFSAVFLGLVVLMMRDLLAMGLGERDFGTADVLAILAWVAAFVPFVLVAALVQLVFEDLVVPIMWLRRLSSIAATKEAFAFVSGNFWIFVLYVLFKVLLAIAVALVGCIVVCLTCCIAALPYIGVVVLLPLYVFGRSYSLEFLAQFGPDYAGLAPALPPAPVEPPAGPAPAGGAV